MREAPTTFLATVPANTHARLNVTERFVVVVGKEKKEIPVITSIATRSSKFFQAAMNHGWKEAHEKRVPLPETRVDIFEGYVQWLYTGHITFTENDTPGYLLLIRFYILGDYLDDVNFHHAVLDHVVAFYLDSSRVPGREIVKFVWDNTTSDSLLRQLILDLWTIMQLDYSITHILGPVNTGYPQDFVHQHFERWMSTNALAGVRGTVKESKQAIADFKLRMSCEGVVADKEVGKKG